MALNLIPVTRDNWEQAISLTTDPEGRLPLMEQWVAGNAYSLLQCMYDPEWDCRILMDDDLAVGFVFYGFPTDENGAYLCRYMVDVRYQNKGYGTRFLPMVLDLIRSRYGCRDVYTTAHDDNHHAIHLYEKNRICPDWVNG